MDEIFELSKQYNNQTLKVQNDFKDTQTTQKKFQQLSEEIQLEIETKEKKLRETKKPMIKTINKEFCISEENCSKNILKISRKISKNFYQ